MAINTGVNTTKLVAYTVLAPNTGVDASKLVAYAVLDTINVAGPLWGTFSFADGFVGVPYSQAWDMPTSALTVTYSVQSGSLPPGLSLSALSGNQAKISGTPTAAGTYNFTLRAVNTYGTVDKAFTIVVSAAPPPASGGAWTWLT